MISYYILLYRCQYFKKVDIIIACIVAYLYISFFHLLGSMFPRNLDDLSAKANELKGTVMTSVSGATEKCSVQ